MADETLENNWSDEDRKREEAIKEKSMKKGILKKSRGKSRKRGVGEVKEAEGLINYLEKRKISGDDGIFKGKEFSGTPTKEESDSKTGGEGIDEEVSSAISVERTETANEDKEEKEIEDQAMVERGCGKSRDELTAEVSVNEKVMEWTNNVNRKMCWRN